MQRKILFLIILTALTDCVLGQQGKTVFLKDQKDSLSYSIGISMGQSLLKTDIDDINQGVFFEALRQKLNSEETLWGMAKADSLLMQYILVKRQARAAENKMQGEKFLSENMKREGVYTTSSGLQYEILKTTKGERPSLYSTIKCVYKGMTIDGRVFDQNLNREEPLQIKVTDMIEGWVEGIQMMPVGAKWRLYIPSELAYKERGAGRAVGANEALVFEIELLDIVHTKVIEEKNRKLN